MPKSSESDYGEDESIISRNSPNCADSYELEKFKTNLLIIYNHQNFIRGRFRKREGTDNDEKNLLMTFEKLNFECLTYRDLLFCEIMETMKINIGLKDCTDYGCVFIVIMTYSDDRGLLLASDRSYSEHELIARLCNMNPTLKDKPVVFLIQASRDDFRRNALYDDESFHPSGLRHPLHSDILIFYCSSIEEPSFRARSEGSIFIRSLCKQIDLLADKEDFESICRAVKRDMAIWLWLWSCYTRTEQIIHPVLTSNLMRRLYFQPSGEDPCSDGGSDFQSPTGESGSAPSSSDDEWPVAGEAVSSPEMPASELGRPVRSTRMVPPKSHENFLNNTRRESSAADAKNLKITFEEFGFEVTTHKDENMTDLFEKLTAFSKQDFSACGCVCVAVLTHGSAHGFLEACDVGYSERALFAAFDALANRSLAGKPIVFLIQASRGAKPAGRICVPRLDELPDSSIQLDAAGGSQAACQIKYLPTEANMIIFHSCFGGRAVPKDDRSGSCFVQTLCSQVRSHGGSKHLEKIFRRVRRLVAETSPQKPVTTSTLLKKLFLKRNDPAPI